MAVSKWSDFEMNSTAARDEMAVLKHHPATKSGDIVLVALRFLTGGLSAGWCFGQQIGSTAPTR